MAATGFELQWQSRPVKKERDESKVKSTCPQCLLNVWGKSTAHVDCRDCLQQMLDPHEFGKCAVSGGAT